MLPTVSKSQASQWGRSPDAESISHQYIEYYNDINEKIHAIDSLPAEQRNQPHAQQGRAALIVLQQQLHSIYSTDYTHSQATLASFQEDCASIQSQIAAVFKEAMGEEGLFLDETIIQAAFSAVHSQLRSVNSITQSTQNGLQSTDIEHGTWYIDWTSWNYPVPEGVNTVNIFVGNMHLDGNGKPVIDGFGNMDSAKMKGFIEACHEKGMAVKISLGGGGGSYDRCWDILTKENVSSVAQALADFCHTNKADGVDFDVEEFTSAQDRPEQQAIVGTFIKEFKNIDTNFKTSICTNAGFGHNFPWQGIMKNLLDAASTKDPISGEKTCAVDRVYIMSYYNSLSEEKHWVSGWADWLKTDYHFTPSQISVGLDDTDAHAYDIKEFATWAAGQGFSTCYWEWNPATEKQSNKSTHDIEDAYGS